VTKQNGSGQTGMDKMARTEWYGQNGSNFWNTYLVDKSHK